VIQKCVFIPYQHNHNNKNSYQIIKIYDTFKMKGMKVTSNNYSNGDNKNKYIPESKFLCCTCA
jgi:hypothetical protein